ncbi:hypothetical protein BDV10DRAFT_51820 [Aspergillus recurvatus]
MENRLRRPRDCKLPEHLAWRRRSDTARYRNSPSGTRSQQMRCQRPLSGVIIVHCQSMIASYSEYPSAHTSSLSYPCPKPQLLTFIHTEAYQQYDSTRGDPLANSYWRGSRDRADKLSGWSPRHRPPSIGPCKVPASDLSHRPSPECMISVPVFSPAHMGTGFQSDGSRSSRGSNYHSHPTRHRRRKDPVSH